MEDELFFYFASLVFTQVGFFVHLFFLVAFFVSSYPLVRMLKSYKTKCQQISLEPIAQALAK